MRKTCIIAEHDPWDMQLLRTFVEWLDLRLVRAFDGRDVLRLARVEQPDVIVLERDLPGVLTVSDVLQSLKQDRDTRDIPVVLFSWSAGHGFTADVEHLQKPATFETFRAALVQAGVCSGELPKHG